MGRGELTAKAWARIEPLLPPVAGRGRYWRDHRQVINAILWKLWLRTWTADGTWERILDHVVVKDDSVGNAEWMISVDSSNVRAHQHSAGAREKGDAPPDGSKPSPSTGKPSAAPEAD